MKAVVIEQFGGLDALKLADVPMPKTQDNEVLIKIEYAGVNPVDWKIREGMLKNRLPYQFPLIPGWDCSGTISKVGKGVKNFKEGDEVIAYCRKPVIQNGTYAEYITFDAAHVAKKPKNLTFAEAAAVPLAALTAWQALYEVAKIKKGDSILIHAGAGSVGSFAIQFAKNTGCKVYSTCSTRNVEFVKSLGADVVIDYTKDNFADALLKNAKNGVDVVFDTVGGDTQTESIPCVKKGGILVSIVNVPNEDLLNKAGIRAGYHFVYPEGKELSTIAKLFEDKKIKAPVVQELRLSECKRAQDLSQQGHTRGKIVLKVNTTS